MKGLLGPLLLLLVLTLLLGVAEFAIRHVQPPDSVWRESLGQDRTFVVSEDPRLGYEYGHMRTSENPLFAYDHRNNLFPVSQQDRKTRILLVGDSIAFGAGLEDGNEIGYHLSDILNKGDGKGNYEVLTFAVSGYNLEQKRVLIMEYLLSYDPDVVILQYEESDLWGWELVRNASSLLKPAGVDLVVFEEPVPLALPLPKPLAAPLLRHSHLMRHLSRLAFSYKRANPPYEDGWPEGKRALAELKSALDAESITLRVVLFPLTAEPFDEFDGNGTYARWFRDATSGQGIASLDLYPVFRPYELGEVALDGSGHLNAAGSRIAAEALAEMVLGLPAGEPDIGG